MNEDFYNHPELLLDQVIDNDEIVMSEEEWSQEEIYLGTNELDEKQEILNRQKTDKYFTNIRHSVNKNCK